ncbi:MAG: hypothetical protein DCF19_13935 [Pseudanabaena frigida]|uniref:DUF6841 domain-containing protein n=1 Tax=Pseudanabaena frigida TaxID=945775 RepID=A0A2W4XXD3_9CYAN|nr:MAG: hypothetical protein DCF19_13935 [Pseudanabaena frigida]
MKDQRIDIQNTFGNYLSAFNTLKPTEVESFLHLPSMLMTSGQVVVMHKTDEVLGVFNVLMESLKLKNFAESKIIGSLQVTQLSDNQGLVVGAAKRFDTKNQEIEHFGFTYTLRKVEDKWKIIAGVLHDPETIS